VNRREQDVVFICCVHAGRALELGRELLHKWGYKRVDELIWVKTNSLRRLIVTGRTGHWLNHSKEHCLVGYKGRPAINRCVWVGAVLCEVVTTCVGRLGHWAWLLGLTVYETVLRSPQQPLFEGYCNRCIKS
jgi:N6-adenosine-specific RNA methylase IME4